MTILTYAQIYAKTDSEIKDIQHNNLMNSDFDDLQNMSAKTTAIYNVKETRENLYPSIQEQLDMQYWDIVNETTIWKDKIAEIKLANPLPQDEI
jgi:hypothetical protein